MAKKSTGKDYIAVGIGLEANEQANTAAANAIKQTADGMANHLKTLAGKFDPLKGALENLTKGIGELNNKFANIKVDKLTSGLEDVKKKSGEMAAATSKSLGDIDKAAESTAKKLASFINIDPEKDAAKFKKLADIVNSAFQFAGVESGMKKITTMKDMMVQVGNEIAKVNSKAADALMKNASPDMGNVKLFSIDKYKAEVERAKQEYQKLLDMAAKGGVSGSNISGIASSFKNENLMSYGKDGVPTNTLAAVQAIRDRIAEVTRATSNVIDYNKIDDQVTKLKKSFYDLVPDSLKSKIDALSTPGKWEDTIAGTKKYGDALRKVKEEIDAITTAASSRGEKMWQGQFIPKGYVTDSGTAQTLATKQNAALDLKAQEVLGAAQNAANRNTESIAQKQQALHYGITSVIRDYDTLNQKVQEYNRLNGTSYNIPPINFSKIIDRGSLLAAQEDIKRLRSSVATVFNSDRTDNVLAKRMEAAAEATRKAGVSVKELEDRVEKANRTFSNVTTKTVMPKDTTMLPAVNAAQANVASLIQSSTGSPAEIDRIKEAIRALLLTMQEFKETGTRIKNSTGSIFDNLLKGVPAQLATFAELKKRLDATLSANGRTRASMDLGEIEKVNKQAKQFGQSLNSATLEFEKLAGQKKSGLFSWLPESMSGMAGRLAEFYSLRTVIFAVSNQFREATTAAIGLNQAVHDILAISGASKDQFKAISDSIYDIAKSSRFTATEVAHSMQVLAQAGVADKDLPGVSRQVDYFATATNADPKMAADLATTAINTFGISANEVTRITNAMTAALNLSKLEAAGLSTAFNYLAPQAAQLGMTLESTLGIVATMAQSGIKASTIGTGASQMLKEFSAPKPKLKSMLKEYGISPDDINPMKKEFADIVQVLQDKGVTVDKLFEAMETRVGRAVVAAVNLSAQSFRNMTDSLTGTQSALVAYDKSMEGAKSRLNVTKQSFQELATIIGAAVAPVLIKLVGIITDVVGVLSANEGSLAKTIALVVAAASGFALLYKASAALAALKLGTALASTVSTLGMIATNAVLAAGGVISLDVAVAGLWATMKAGLITSGWGIALVALGYAVYKIADSLGEKRRAQEAATEASLKAIDTHERAAKSLNAVANSTSESSKAMAKYHALIKAGKTHEEALNEVGKVRVTVTDEQKDSIRKLIAEGGPHAEYLKSLLEEGNTLQAVIEKTKILNDARNLRVRTAKDEFNKGAIAAEDSATKDFDANTHNGQAYAGGKFLSKEETIAARDKIREKAGKKFREENRALENTATAPTVINGEVVEENFAERNRIVGHWVAAPKKPKVNTRPDDRMKKGDPFSTLPALMENIIDHRIKELENQYDENKNFMSTDEREQFKLGFNDPEKVASMYEALASGNTKPLKDGATLQDLYNMKGTAKSDKAKEKLKKMGDKKVTAANRKLADEVEGFAQAEYEAKLEKEVEADAKVRQLFSEKMTEAVAKIKEEEDKRLATIEITNLTKELGRNDITEEARADAFDKYKTATEKRIKAEEAIRLQSQGTFREYNEKVKLGEYVSDADKSEYEKAKKLSAGSITKQVDESTKAGEKVMTDGILAAENKRIDTINKIRDAKLAELDLAKSLAVGGEAVNKIEAEKLQVQLEADDAVRGEITETYELLALLKLLTSEQREAQQARLDGADAEIAKKERLYELAKDTSFLGNFSQGAKSAWNQQSDFKGATNSLGSNITNTGINGISDSIFNTFGSSQAKQDEKAKIRQEITNLNVQKNQLEASIASASAGGFMTPEMGAKAAQQKIQLTEVNKALKVQEDSLKKLGGGWANFAQSLKKVMVQILEELQKYIIKMLVVGMVKKVIGMATNYDTSQAGLDSTGDYDFIGPVVNRTGGYAATGGLITNSGVKYYSDGGAASLSKMFVPKGTDTIPAMLTLGEVVIQKSAVDYYGADKMLALNAKKIARFSEGGMVGGNGTSNSGEKQQNILQIVNILPGEQIPDPGTQANQVINVISADINRRGRIFKDVKNIMMG